jgi:predicted Abi (CAAX) family protease
VRKLCRTTLLSVIAMLSLQLAILFVPRVFAGAVPAPTSAAKKKAKFKRTKYKAKKQKILKGHHGRHRGKPA